MGKFAKPEKQAEKVMEKLAPHIRSLGTQRNYKQSLKNVANWCKSEKKGGLESMTREKAISYLEQRSEAVEQKTLDMERQALQSMMKHVTGELDSNLSRIKSELVTTQITRSYTQEQTNIIANSQSDKYSLSTLIAKNAGLRAHELLTLAKVEERSPDTRPTHENKWVGRENTVSYTVRGKGGLIREVRIDRELSQKLEERRNDKPETIKDRGIYYKSNYNIGGGAKFSDSFRKASDRTLNWNTGAHGVRHSYAQERMKAVMELGHSRKDALLIVSQELGHFRPEIVEVYLR